ncbi:MAG: DUF2975 domain-containing protein [Ruthenibacterium sp.]
MKWTADQSVRLSRACIWLFAVLAVVICAVSPALTHTFGSIVLINGKSVSEVRVALLVTEYAAAVLGLAALWLLHRLLLSIGAGSVFVEKNVFILRALSWCCLGAGLVFFGGAWIGWPPFALLAACAAFMGLILRVVKNVFAEAVRMKAENDGTV